MGDDSFDIELLEQVAFSACPPEAVEDVRNVVHYVSKVSAGRGCVREVIDLILKKQGKIQNVKRETSNIELQTSNVKRETIVR